MRNSTFVCKKHKKNARGYWFNIPKCPICREEMKCMGFKHRIGKDGDFERKERKTRKLKGQIPIKPKHSRAWKEYLKKLEDEKKKTKIVSVKVDYE